jgi:hypothetical protein
MTFYFHPQAEAELVDAVNYYDQCEFGLGWNLPKRFIPPLSDFLNIRLPAR